jgi:isoquinoline 1-oxidoreductase alpha subunit
VLKGITVSYKIRVNGTEHTVEAEGDTPLLWVLRDMLGLTGTKYGCGIGACGACTVQLDGSPTRSCSLPLATVGAMEITTIEGIGATALGKRVQDAWLAHDVPQCGYCQGGQILAATALLKSTAKPTDADIDNAMVGNICRCGTYLRIRAAIKDIAAQLKR